jgi:hypothetical protein
MLPPCHTAAMMLKAQLGPGLHATEPYEAGWAREAAGMLYVEELEGPLRVHLEVSADGLRWIVADSRSVDAPGAYQLALAGFGNWLRASFDVGNICRADFYWVLK